MNTGIRCQFNVDRVGPRVVLRHGPDPVIAPSGNVPRISRLVALAHRFADQIRSGSVATMADLAVQRGITRGRMTQIMDLLLLAPDIQKELLMLPRTERGRAPITLRAMRYVCATLVWSEQRKRWAEIKNA
jgi:hypothetical protein